MAWRKSKKKKGPNKCIGISTIILFHSSINFFPINSIPLHSCISTMTSPPESTLPSTRADNDRPHILIIGAGLAGKENHDQKYF